MKQQYKSNIIILKKTRHKNVVKLKPGSRISQIFPNHLHIFLANLRAFRKNMGMYLCKVRHLIFRLFLELHIQIGYHYSKFFILGKEFLEKSIMQKQYACTISRLPTYNQYLHYFWIYCGIIIPLPFARVCVKCQAQPSPVICSRHQGTYVFLERT